MDTGTIVSVVIGFLGGLWSVWKVLSGKIDKLEERAAKLEGDARVAIAERAAIRDVIHEQLAALAASVEKISIKFEKHIDEEPHQLRRVLREVLADLRSDGAADR